MPEQDILSQSRRPTARAALSVPWDAEATSDEKPVTDQDGLSLVELLVAMAVGLFLVGGIIQVLVSGKASYRLGEAEARVQENGRFAIQLLATDLRAARSAGCRSAALDHAEASLNVVACDLLDPGDDEAGCSGVPAIGPDRPLGYGVAQQGAADWLAGLSGNNTDPAYGAQHAVASQWLRGDVIVTWNARGEGVYATVPEDAGESDLTRPIALEAPQKDLIGGRLALVSDCEWTDIFAITNPQTCQSDGLLPPSSLEHQVTYDGDGSPGDCSADTAAGSVDAAGSQANKQGVLSRVYDRRGTVTSPGATLRARVLPFEYKVYYICCMDGREGAVQAGDAVGNCGSEPDRYRPALCRWSTATSPHVQALASDVADLRVVYDGYAHPASGVRFLDLPGVISDATWVSQSGNWDRVDSARIQVLATAAESVRTSTAAPAPEASVPGDLGYGLRPDRRIYKPFEVTVAIRSSSLWFVGP